MKKNIPYGKQNITQEDVDAVISTLNSDYLTQGPRIKEFEDNFAKYVESKYAVAVSSGTAALHLSVIALGLEKGQKVITTPITFAASANCISYCGADAVFADIDPQTYLIDISYVEELLKKDNKIVGIIPVNFAGRPVNLEDLKKVVKKYNIWILEDACHAPGGFFTDSTGTHQYCGNGNFANAAIFSFHPVKHIAAGEGGMITTNDEKLYNQLLNLRTHGITKNCSSFKNPLKFAQGNQIKEELGWPNWYMEMHELGFNYRLTDIQAALANSQLVRAKKGVDKRRLIAKKYFNSFNNQEFILEQSGIVNGHAYHLYVIQTKNRLGLYNFLRKNGIYAQIHYIPCHLMPYYRNKGWKNGDLPNAEKYYESCISLPMYPTLTNEEQSFVIEKVKEFYLR